MLTGIDHFIILIPELETGIKNYEQLGFKVVPGGTHPTGTHNALLGFADGSYLELLAFFEPKPESKLWPKLEQGGGLVDWCVQTDNLLADMAAFRKAGVEMSDPMPLSRVRPDGYKLDWVLSVHGGSHRGVVPFLIEDRTPRDERVPKEKIHPNKVTGVDTLTIVVDDVETVRGWYASVLGTEGLKIERADLETAGVRFMIGPHGVDFVAPAGSSGTLSDWMRSRGPSPYAATLTTAAGKAGLLDETKSLGARLFLT
ncbi:MAG: VOC family protein [Pyrinomonadaceae bacterium]